MHLCLLLYQFIQRDSNNSMNAVSNTLAQSALYKQASFNLFLLIENTLKSALSHFNLLHLCFCVSIFEFSILYFSHMWNIWKKDEVSRVDRKRPHVCNLPILLCDSKSRQIRNRIVMIVYGSVYPSQMLFHNK